MRGSDVYIGSLLLPVSPAKISFVLPTLSARYELVGAGEAEILQGAKLAEIQIEGYFPADSSAMTPQECVEKITEMVDKGQPFRFIYVGKRWDLNMLCSMQDPEFLEVGGSFDISYKLKMRKWVEVTAKLTKNPETRPRESQLKASSSATSSTTSSYTVKKGDTLSGIAKNAYDDSSKWRDIYEQNKHIIKNPNLIYPGQNLMLPDASTLSSSKSKSSYSYKSSKSSSSSKKSKSSSSASKGANSNTLTVANSGKETTSYSYTKKDASVSTKPSPAPKYSSAQDFYKAFT